MKGDSYIFFTNFRSLDASDSSESSEVEEGDVVRGKRFQAVTCIGRQLGSTTFVFGPTLHISELGEVIPKEYIWVPWILQHLHRVVCLAL